MLITAIVALIAVSLYYQPVHTQPAAVCHRNLSETKVLTTVLCAACCTCFMREITSFSPSSTVPTLRKHSHPLPPWPHATIRTAVSSFLTSVPVSYFSCAAADKLAS